MFRCPTVEIVASNNAGSVNFQAGQFGAIDSLDRRPRFSDRCTQASVHAAGIVYSEPDRRLCSECRPLFGMCCRK